MEYRVQPDGRGSLRGGLLTDSPVNAMPDTAAAMEAGVVSPVLAAARGAQQTWAALPIRRRLAIVRRLRHAIARHAETLAAAVPLTVPGSLHRNLADTLVTEVLPLAEACRYLELEAKAVLAPRKHSRRGRPFLLRHVEAVVERAPFGVVLILGPANYPLFLPAVQTLQALVAGNAVLWKPATTGVAAANLLLSMLLDAGLPPHLVTVLDTNIEAAQSAIAAGVDKVVLTGHISTGRAVLRSLADRATPVVMELSGCDPVFLLPGADLEHAARAIAFGLRLNGSATCMAPRRLFLAASEAASFLPLLEEALRNMPPTPLPPHILDALESLVEDAQRAGAQITRLATAAAGTAPVLIIGATPAMHCMQTDIFAPLLSVMTVADVEEAVAAQAACPYALTASIFGPEREAAALAKRLHVGIVLINDIIVATADPRLSFGGRGQSGFGVTRGREGLLEMTTIKTIATQRSSDERAYAQTTGEHAPFFSAYIRTVHSGTWPERFRAMRALSTAARRIPSDASPRARTRKR